jgi:thymidylate synthase (FAD)
MHTKKHHGICDHHVVTVRLIIDRGISHEVVRHRIAAYLQESTRYCDYITAGKIQVIDIGDHMTEEQYEEWWLAMCDAERHYNNLRHMGCAPEIARSVLPNSLKTEIIMTMDLTAWRNFFVKRTSSAAHPQMREIAIPLLEHFKKNLPVIFDDIEPGAMPRRPA